MPKTSTAVAMAAHERDSTVVTVFIFIKGESLELNKWSSLAKSFAARCTKLHRARQIEAAGSRIFDGQRGFHDVSINPGSNARHVVKNNDVEELEDERS
jgi:hypothetical protein